MINFCKKTVIVLSLFLSAVFAFADSGEPGTFDNATPKAMSDVLSLDAKLKPSDDEFTIYYVRPNKDYDIWALWIWANPGGDGAAAFPFTQNWTVQDGIGYMRLKLDGSSTGGTKLFSDKGDVGLIVRQKEEWKKDGKDDRFWNINTSKKIAIFSGDQTTYAAVDYKPSIKIAELSNEKTITLKLSGKYGLDKDGGASGFSVSSSSGKEYKIAKVYNTSNPKDFSQNMTDAVTLELQEKVTLGDTIKVNNEKFLTSATVNSTKLEVKIAESKTPAMTETLGCVFSGGKATFRLWAPTSSKAVLNIYKTGDAKNADFTIDMTFNDKTGVWSCVFDKENADGYFYDYTLNNSKGTVTVLDPYAISMNANKGDGAVGRAAIIDLSSEKVGASSSDYVKLAKREDAIIYEVSVRDFTINPDAKTSEKPGTYKAFIEKIPYLKELGVTHVQLLPVVNFFYNDETNKEYENSGKVNGNNYNWGYDPHNYFTPEGWYATDATDPYCRVKELRELINACHEAGLGVLLDVVYNHMASTQFLDDIVPGYYFRLNDKGGFKSNSGCGNDTATERKMMKKLVMDSTAHWVKNYKADGFRFDLMGLMEASSVVDSYNACAKINPAILFEGEGWKMYNGESGTLGMDQNYMTQTNKVSVFNDEFRDLIKAGGFNETGRGLVTKKATDNERFFRNATGSPMSNYRADSPGDNLNYTTCHDGLTLHDCIVHNLHLDEKKDRAEIVARMKLANFIVLTSQGLSFLHAGQERGRTKPNVTGAKNESIGNFVRNSYDSSDNINQIVWNIDTEYQNLLEYTKGLIAIRKEFGVFRIGDAKKVAKNIKEIETGDESGLVFGYTIKDKKNKWIVLINANSEKSEINCGVNSNSSVIYIDSDVADKNGIANPVGVTISGTSVVLAPLTATVICSK